MRGTRSFSRRIRRTLFSNPLKDDSTRDDAETKNDFWSVMGDFIYRHQVEPRVKLYVLKEESFLPPLEHIDDTRTTHTLLDVLLEKHIDDHWNVTGEKRIVRCMDRLDKICSIKGKATGRIHMVRGETDQETKISRPDSVRPDMWKHMSDAAKKKAKQRWAIEKPKLGNARLLRGIFFIEPEDEEFKHTMKAARGKLEIQMPAALPCKTPTNCRGETCRNVGKHKTKYACVVDADESTRPRLEGAGHKPHQHLITVLCINSFRCLKHQQYRMQRRRWRKNGEN